MGGRGGAGGGIGAKSAYETKLRENFKVTDYGGKTIAKVGSSYGIYDFSRKPKSGKDSDYLVNTAKRQKRHEILLISGMLQIEKERNNIVFGVVKVKVYD